MRLRAPRPDDLPALVGLERAAFGARAWSTEAVRDELDAVGTTRWVMVAGGEGSVDGYVDLMPAGDDADLVRVVVASERRRTGLGRALVSAALSHAASVGCRQVLLEVAADNDPAIALYLACGFVEIDRRPRYYEGRVDAVVMVRPVAATGDSVVDEKEVADA